MRRPARSAAVLVGAALAAAACSSSHPAPNPTPVPAGLVSTVDHGRLLCGFLSRANAVTALGREDLTGTGAVVAGTGRTDGIALAAASCAVTVPDGGQSPAISVSLTPIAGQDVTAIVRKAHGSATDLVYPATDGVGFAVHDSYVDPAGRHYLSAQSSLLRGDWKLSVGENLPASGRDALADVVAISEQVVAQLNLPLKPSTPYPTG